MTSEAPENPPTGEAPPAPAAEGGAAPPATQAERQHAAFKLFDDDGINAVKVEVVGTVIRSLGINPSDQDIENLINEVNTSDDGTISFEDFKTIATDLEDKCGLSNEEVLLEAFKRFDRDQTGLISVAELRHCLTQRGGGEEKMTEEEVEEVLRDIDLDAEGNISYPVFAKFIMAP
eukprot:GFYU01013499.1.p1 GENE.GFYU01013499.1~~GFYU01013499.1.p1  ORF type:complete len:176 (-),score=50.42 GFYU01013499.1:204-731(-)